MADMTAQIKRSMSSLSREFELVTNNLANVNTSGYKRQCNAFSKVLESKQNNQDPTGIVEVTSSIDFSQGNIIQTKRSLDFAINGDGFFVVDGDQGQLYTRNGCFGLSVNGQIVDGVGRIVEGQSGAITVPRSVSPSQLSVSSDGTITSGEITIGQFKLVEFGDDQNKLEQVGLNCFQISDEQVRPIDAENPMVQQGYQESSNVKMVEELVDMMMVTRLYEANMKIISTKRDASKNLISLAMG